MQSSLVGVLSCVCGVLALGISTWNLKQNGVAHVLPSILSAPLNTTVTPVVDFGDGVVSYTWRDTATLGVTGVFTVGVLTTTTHTGVSIIATDVTVTGTTTVDDLTTTTASHTTVDTTTLTCTTLNTTSANFTTLNVTSLSTGSLSSGGAEAVSTFGEQVYSIPVGTDQHLAVFNRTVATTYPLEAIVRHYEALGVASGTFTSGSWQTRVLNQVDDPDDIGVTLASNVITIPPGSYYLTAYARGYEVNSHTLRIYDVTHDTALEHGHSYGGSTTPIDTHARVDVLYASENSTDIRIDHQCENTSATGFGLPSLYGPSTYAWVRIQLYGVV